MEHISFGEALVGISQKPPVGCFSGFGKSITKDSGDAIKNQRKKNPKMKVILSRGSNLAFMSRKILRKLVDQREDS